jgi:UDP-glucose 4-epimerase
VSSRDVYGSALKPREENVTCDSPNGYAASKLSGEALVNSYRHTKNLSATSLRLANVYGPRDLNPRVVPTFIALAENGEELSVYGERKLLDFVHVKDVCRAIRKTIGRSHVVDGEAINVGSGTGSSLFEVASQISEYIEACPGWSVSPDRKGDVTRYVSNLSKASALLNFEPKISLINGLENTVDWYLDRPMILSTIRSKV